MERVVVHERGLLRDVADDAAGAERVTSHTRADAFAASTRNTLVPT